MKTKPIAAAIAALVACQATPAQLPQAGPGGASPRIFAQITKMDVAKREVWGRLVQEVPDRSDEIFDYEASKPYFKAWSDEFSAATDGKSLGNVRAMHGKVAAGKFIAMDFNDAEKAIDVGAKIIDDAEWKKCEEGVYTGFSIGGSYVGSKKAEKVNGRDVLRYTANPAEGSLVDSPCIPTAKFFDVVKADGVIEKVAFKAAAIEVTGTDDQVAEFADALNKAGLGMADAIALVKAHKACPVDPATIADAIELVKAHKPDATPPADPAPAVEPHPLVKAAQEYVDAEAELGKSLDLTGDAFDAAIAAALTPEEIAAVAKDAPATMGKALRTAAIAKGTGGHAQKIHDMLGEMGAKCAKDAPAGDLAKGAAPEVAAQLTEALARIQKLEKQPVPFVTLRAVAKGAPTDTTPAPSAITMDDLKPEDMLKNADGSIDYVTSLFVAREKAMAKAAVNS